MSTLAIPFGRMAVAPETEGVAEMFEDTHIGSALGTDDFRVLAVPGWATRCELVPTIRVFAAESLKPPVRILTKAVNLATTAGTTHFTNWFSHKGLLSERGVRLRETMKIATPSPERSLLIKNLMLMR